MGTERLNGAVWISQANPCAPSSVNSPPAPPRTGSQLSYDIQLAFEHVEEGSATLLHEVEVECRDNEPYALFCGRRTPRQLAMDQPHVVLPLAQRHPTSQWPGRCIAPDLIGMGDSDKLPDSGPNSYTFVEHRRFLDALFDALGVRENVAFVVHDRGSALGFDWAYR